jgi:hypothetical protein
MYNYKSQSINGQFLFSQCNFNLNIECIEYFLYDSCSYIAATICLEVGEHQGAFRVSATFNNISVISWKSVLLMEEKPTYLLQVTDNFIT